MQRQTRSLAPLVIVCFAVLLPAAYPLSYLALADHDYLHIGCIIDKSRRGAYYRFGEDTVATFYRPLERLDRWARPAYWNPTKAQLRVMPVEDLEEIQELGGGICDINVEDIPLEIDPLADDNSK